MKFSLSLAQVLGQNLQTFNGCKKNYLLSFIPFILFILIVLIFPSKDWKTKKKKPFSICSSTKKTLQVHTYLLKTAFFTVLMSQLSVSQMIHFKDMLTWKAEQILFAEGKKNNLNRNAQFFQGHFIHFYSRVSTSSCPADTPSGKYLGYL